VRHDFDSITIAFPLISVKFCARLARTVMSLLSGRDGLTMFAKVLSLATISPVYPPWVLEHHDIAFCMVDADELVALHFQVMKNVDAVNVRLQALQGGTQAHSSNRDLCDVHRLPVVCFAID
jgi:hypothetical protein